MTSVRNIEKALRDLPDKEISELLEVLRTEAGVEYSRFPRNKTEKVAAILYLLRKYPHLNTLFAAHDLAPALDSVEESFDWGEAIGKIGRAIFGGGDEEQKQPVQVIVEQPQQNTTPSWIPYAILGMFALMLIVVLIAVARG